MTYSYLKTSVAMFVAFLTISLMAIPATGHDRVLEGETAQHALIGKLILPDGIELTSEQLEGMLTSANFVLLGELHDNRWHHENQAIWLWTIANSGKRPAVVFEMIPRSMQATVDEFLSRAAPDPSDFGDLVKWEERGWPDWEFYQPIMDVILEYDLPIIAAGIPREELFEIGQKGLEALDEKILQDFALIQDLPDVLENDLLTELEASHCGMLPKAALTGMVPAQRIRDGSLAAAMVDGLKTQGSAVMIAGNGHVRDDRGAPFYLRQLSPDADMIVIGQIAVTGDMKSVETYRSEQAVLPYDIVAFTKANAPVDHCAEMRKRFGQTETPE